ncbi:DUF5694 domain-containing protein [Rhodocytophaga aerolata]|uniref:DUF5694 domain-containing protein n=1 Tax=Rhodocytophaga aerolata TaxID=455078 RepID=A0ABT8R786_9BACT|nr:DUF5694 domain-containing protein [Rhodocytophaga aerolata]MDO1447966.1 DUF5694 domain-containing protein [Rhodocytophaga aerolata]
MKKLLLLLFSIWVMCIPLSAQTNRTEILLLGSDHLAQIYKKEYPNTDVLLPAKQKELQAFTALIEKYNPDMIMVEVLPEEQKSTDSLYALYLKNTLNLAALENGRSEVYQLAFRLGKKIGLPRIYCVNAPGGTSQSVLDNGENIELYKNETVALRKIVSEKYQALQKGTLSLKEYLTFVNQPQTYNLIYHLRYITPARVVNGTFKNPDEMIDTAFVNPAYIGAELISVFKNRDYKIYSNIVTTQLAHTPARILLIIGVAHIGSLKNIFQDDPDYKVIDAVRYLNQ